jgi:glucokinase-like ROK family protein
VARTQSRLSGTDHSAMRELNRSLVLDLLRQHGQMSRPALSKATGLAKPTIAAIVDDLVAEKLVREIGLGRSTPTGGRPPLMVEFNPRSKVLVGVQIGAFETVISVADARGSELYLTSIPTPRGKPAAAMKKIIDAIESAIAAAGESPDRLAGLGVCVLGLVDAESGVCAIAPNLGWKNVPVRDLLSEVLEVPVYVHNAAHALAVAEALEGAGRGAADVVALSVGSGVGAGVLIDGRLYHGSAGFAGELGHCPIPGLTLPCTCGNTGCLETITASPALVRRVRELLEKGERSVLGTDLEGLRPRDVVTAAAEGDDVCLRAVGEIGHGLGLAAAWLINLFNPQVLVVGGSLSAAGEPLIGPLREAAFSAVLPQAASSVEIKTSELGVRAKSRGAVLLAKQSSETYLRVVFQG